jgi:hypothetical protein
MCSNLRRAAVPLSILLAAGFGAVFTARGATPPPRARAATPAEARAAIGRLPLCFVENRGQLDSRVAYAVSGEDTSVYFTPDGVTYALSGTSPSAPGARHAGISTGEMGSINKSRPNQRWAVKLDFVGANREVQPVGEGLSPGTVSYFKGPRTAWRSGLPSYRSVAYRNLWPGIDLACSGTAGRLKYTFVVQPGADPNRIRLAYRGATQVRLNEAGQLEVSTPAGGFKDDRPLVYQEVDGHRQEVPSAYVLEPNASAERTVYAFRLGEYDHSRPLVLDPAVLTLAGYIGGDQEEEGSSIAVDRAGFIYVAGVTKSTEGTFPVKVGPDRTYRGAAGTGLTAGDAFVAKIDPQNGQLIYAGYIGGSSRDEARALAVDSDGNAYIAGLTGSGPDTFPVTQGPGLTYNGGTGDAFVAKVNPTGTALLYCGYIGGDQDDAALAVAVDAAGHAYVSGVTRSTEATFPVVGGPGLKFKGAVDAFVAKVDVDGKKLIYNGYIGGTQDEAGVAIAVDAEGSAYVAGRTHSDQASFPVAVGPGLTFKGGFDAFVAKVRPDGSSLAYCGYVGGSSDDDAQGIALDSAGNAYITGKTDSSEATFPVAVGPDLTFNGGDDAYVAKVRADGSGLVYCGYIGGSGNEYSRAIAVNAAGQAFVTGLTNSTEGTFPVVSGPDLTYNGGASDAFVAQVNEQGSGLLMAGYIGGDGADEGHGIALDAKSNVYVTGITSSTEATFPILLGPGLKYSGAVDAFVARIAP